VLVIDNQEHKLAFIKLDTIGVSRLARNELEEAARAIAPVNTDPSSCANWVWLDQKNRPSSDQTRP
jgi:hypothetical protein